MSRPSHIMLVDDNSGDLVLFAEALQDLCWNAELETHQSGHGAINSLKNGVLKGWIPDFIVLDYWIPPETCTHTLASIRAMTPLASTPIMVYSSAAPTDCMMRELEAFGVLRVLEKPSDFTGTISLVTILRKFLLGTGNISAGGSWMIPEEAAGLMPSAPNLSVPPPHPIRKIP